MLAHLLAGLLVVWTPSHVDCNGGPEEAAFYVVRWRYVQIDYSMDCGDKETGIVPCYIGSPGWDAQHAFLAPANSYRTTLPLHDPGPGEVYVYDVEAFDVAGNADCGP